MEPGEGGGMRAPAAKNPGGGGEAGTPGGQDGLQSQYRLFMQMLFFTKIFG